MIQKMFSIDIGNNKYKDTDINSNNNIPPPATE